MPGKQGRQKQGKPDVERLPELPLPPCNGPKLPPFADRSGSLEFIRILSDPTSEGATHVFEVKINSHTYALKIFKHYYPDLEDWLLVGHERRATSKDALDHLEWYCDPFYNECRAYGRLMESRLNGKAAVRCYGYMMLPDKYEQELKRRFGAGDWQRPSNEYEVPFSQRQNLRAIVKDMVFEQTDWTTGVKKKLGDLRRIHKRKVYVRDIKEENYVGGLLVDFSIALTEPRFMFDIKDPKWTHIEKSSERVAGEHVL